MSILLERRADLSVLATEYDGDLERQRTRLGEHEVARFVAQREQGHPRWVWNDTYHWYPALLAAGVRVERCWDLRLCHRILRGSERARLEYGDAEEYWEARPAPARHRDADALFTLVEAAREDVPSAADEWHRQLESLRASRRGRALRLLLAAESSGALCARELERAGIPWHVDAHERILTRLLGPRPAYGMHPVALVDLAARIRDLVGAPHLNLDSPPEVLRALKSTGIPAESTRAHALEHLDHPVIAPLLAYKKLYRLWSANGWAWLDAWVREGRFRPEYVVAGVVSGRWAAHGGGALQLPKIVRPAVIADEGWTFVVGDIGQLEPRVLAGRAGDDAMAAAGRGGDLYSGIVASGAVADRAAAKTAMLGALYGATTGDSARLAPRLQAAFPRSMAFVDEAASRGESGEPVSSLLGRSCPSAASAWWMPRQTPAQQRAARDWGRFTRNFVVQATAAEWALCWLAELRNRLHRLEVDSAGARPELVYFLHDEVVVHCPAALAPRVCSLLRECAAAAGRHLFGEFRLDFPVGIRVDRSYAEQADAARDDQA